MKKKQGEVGREDTLARCSLDTKALLTSGNLIRWGSDRPFVYFSDAMGLS